MNLWAWLTDSFTALQEALCALAAPLLFSLGMGNLLEDAYAASAWLLAGVLQILVILLIFGPLQRWRPVEAVPDRATIRTDMIYTLIHRLGLFRVLLSFCSTPCSAIHSDSFGWLVWAPFIWTNCGLA